MAGPFAHGHCHIGDRRPRPAGVQSRRPVRRRRPLGAGGRRRLGRGTGLAAAGRRHGRADRPRPAGWKAGGRGHHRPTRHRRAVDAIQAAHRGRGAGAGPGAPAQAMAGDAGQGPGRAQGPEVRPPRQRHVDRRRHRGRQCQELRQRADLPRPGHGDGRRAGQGRAGPAAARHRCRPPDRSADPAQARQGGEFLAARHRRARPGAVAPEDRVHRRGAHRRDRAALTRRVAQPADPP